MTAPLAALAAGVLGVLVAGHALAAEPVDPDDEVDAGTAARFKRLDRPRGGYGRVAAGLTFGRGIRFNNPYRLTTVLGETAESLSATAPYVDTSIDLAFGDPEGLQHGGTIHLCFALEGVAQQAISGSYVLSYRGLESFGLWGRLGPSLLVTPDANVGGELAVGGAYYVTGVWGITAELVGNLFYGAGTWQIDPAVYPILSAQAGIVADFEVLP